MISHVPGGIGVFETVIILAIPQVPASSAASAPCWSIAQRTTSCRWPFAAICSAPKSWKRAAARIARAHELASLYIAPIVPQVAGTLTFLAGVVLLISGATPAIDARLDALRHVLPLAILELSHLAGSAIGRRPHRAGARAVPARAGGLSHFVLAAGAPASSRRCSRASTSRKPSSSALVLMRAHARPARVLSAHVDSRRALHADLGSEHRRRHRRRHLDRDARVSPRRILARAVVDVRAGRERAARACARCSSWCCSPPPSCC